MADPQTLNETLQSQIGEQDGAREKLLRLCRQNKLAVVSAVVILLILLMAVFAPLIAPYGEAEQDALNRLQPPSAEHWFGTDELGRDVFSRVLYGSRLSLAIGILPSIVSLAIGILAGLLAGYFGGWLDYIIMRIADVMLSIPSLLLAMVVMYTLGSSTVNLFVALSMVGWASVARVVRSQTLSIKESEYVEAARSIGVSRWTIMRRHILPNCMAPIIVQATLSIAGSILAIASLSFIGLGISPPTPEWGSMVSTGRQYFRAAWWVCAFPGLAIMLTILSLNLLGDGLRDALDPKLKN